MDAYTLLPPAYRRAGQSYTLEMTAENDFRDACLRVQQVLVPCGDGLLRIVRSWENVSDEALSIQPMLSVRAEFAPTHTVIPCVSYDGNVFGGGKEPKGLTCEGQPWVFAYNRTGIPSCTLSENSQQALALFASDEDASSLVSSCSMSWDAQGKMVHTIVYPIIEQPYTYCSRDRYTDGFESFITLKPQQRFQAAAYLWSGAPRRVNFGMANVEDIALRVMHPAINNSWDTERLWDAGIAFARRLSMDYDGGKLLSIGLSLKGEPPVFTLNEHFEIGWCGQNGLYARMLIRDYEKNGHKDSLDLGCAILDAWTQKAMSPCGLMYTHYEKQYTQPHYAADTCNLGFAAAECIRSYRLLKRLGIEKEAYLAAAQSICDFFLRHYSDAYGFGKTWDVVTGHMQQSDGTIGAYLIPAFAELFRETGCREYLEMAERAFAFYATRDLAHFVCTAGALDTDCTDKETSCALIMGAILLYECTLNKDYLFQAENAAYYFCSWMYHYDGLYDAHSDFARCDYHTAGGTSVSAQHHHIDPWGASVAGWLMKLSAYTGEEKWAVRARMLFQNTTQCVTMEENMPFHGHVRPLGSQNEAYYQCRWPDEFMPLEAGRINDWLVAWPGAFRLWALDMAREPETDY